MKIQKMKTKLAAVGLALTFAVSHIGFPVTVDSAQGVASSTGNFEITNPYEDVNWDTFGQYKAVHHAHTTFLAASNTRRDMLLDKYAKGFDIAPISDHNTPTTTRDVLSGPYCWNDNWNNIGTAVLVALELLAIEAGIWCGSCAFFRYI